MPTTLRDWYDTPLYYDIVFDDGTAREADFLEGAYARYECPADEACERKPGDARRRLEDQAPYRAPSARMRSAGGAGGPQPAVGVGAPGVREMKKAAQRGPLRLLEPACGSGRLALEMARRGWEVCGFDGNANMIAFAQERLAEAGLRKKARLWEDWMQSFTLPKGVKGGFDMAHCLVSTFKYLLAEKDAAECLRRVAAALRPGGVFFLGLHLTDYDREGDEHERWVARRGDVHVVCNTHTWAPDPKARLENLRTRLKITDAGRTHTQETRWQFRTYSAAQLKALLRKVPELEYVECYDFTYDLSEPRKFDDAYADVLLVLRKREG